MLASTVQFSKNNQIHQNHCERRPDQCQVVHPRLMTDHRKTLACSLRTQQRTDSVHPALPTPFHAGKPAVLTVGTTERLASQHPLVSCPSVNTFDPRTWKVLLRKEVIQPHLPVRLPCYDFVPIASPTFDRSPHCWLGHGLRVLPTFVT